MHMDDVRAFGELLFLLLSGTGDGYSVQSRHVNRLPSVKQPRQSGYFIVQDSIYGWAQALDALIDAYFLCRVRPEFDFSMVSPKGTLLLTTGARAPGPEPLKHMLESVEARLKRAIGRKLIPLEVHDINCIISNCVLAGGIRRAALIALFDRWDEEMLRCKSGEWWIEHPERGRANNSAVLPRDETTYDEFKHVFDIMRHSGAGEPGFCWTDDPEMGMNPCVEASLWPKQFCNLTTVVQTTVESFDDFLYRAEAAAFIGTLQASYTDFPYRRPEWQETTERDALIGVSCTGVCDVPGLVTPEWLEEGAVSVLNTNERTAKQIGINIAARTTLMKPEGSGSKVTCSRSGIGSGWNDFLINRVQINKNDDLAKYFERVVPELCEDVEGIANTMCIKIPQELSEGGMNRDDETALQFLDRVMTYNRHWIAPGHREGPNKHNVSCTVNVREHEWDGVLEYMWKHRTEYTGIALLPYDGGNYKQAPLTACTREEFEKLDAYVRSKNIDLRQVHEGEDNTEMDQIIACGGGKCEVSF